MTWWGQTSMLFGVFGTSTPEALLLETAAWILTFALHSTVLVGGVWIGSKIIRSHAWRDTLWKAALAGGVITASLQTCFGIDPLFGRLNPWSKFWSPPVQAVIHEDHYESLHSMVFLTPETSPGVTGTASGSEVVPVMHWWNSRNFWASVLVGLTLLAAMFELSVLLNNRRRLRRALSRRRPCSDPHIVSAVESLRQKAGITRPVAVTTMRLLPAPIALHNEICLPERALEQLDADQLYGVLAHEVAHLKRWDPVLYQAVAVLEALFSFQPLLRVARKNLRDEAEYVCDDWASVQTGSTITLAESLIEVASWTAVDDPAPAPALTSHKSLLARRVQRLLVASSKDRINPPLHMRFTVALLILLIVAWVAPGITAQV